MSQASRGRSLNLPKIKTSSATNASTGKIGGKKIKRGNMGWALLFHALVFLITFGLPFWGFLYLFQKIEMLYAWMVITLSLLLGFAVYLISGGWLLLEGIVRTDAMRSKLINNPITGSLRALRSGSLDVIIPYLEKMIEADQIGFDLTTFVLDTIKTRTTGVQLDFAIDLGVRISDPIIFLSVGSREEVSRLLTTRVIESVDTATNLAKNNSTEDLDDAAFAVKCEQLKNELKELILGILQGSEIPGVKSYGTADLGVTIESLQMDVSLPEALRQAIEGRMRVESAQTSFRNTQYTPSAEERLAAMQATGAVRGETNVSQERRDINARGANAEKIAEADILGDAIGDGNQEDAVAGGLTQQDDDSQPNNPK